jgi:GNAT superfamily N-acetyltransferase
LTWVAPDSGARDLVDAVAVLEAARGVDAPWEPPLTVGGFAAGLLHGWDGDPSWFALARDRAGPIGVVEVGRPRWDNHHVGYLNITVDPRRRRRGLGRRLHQAGLQRVRAEGRTLLLAECHDSPAALGFCAGLGLERAYRSAKRRLDLVTLDQGRLTGIGRKARQAASGYDLVRLPGPVPPGLLSQVVALTAMINDAPVDDLRVDDEIFTAERIRAFETAQAAHGRRMYRLVACERSTGELAGHTIVAVDGEHPWHAWQYDTSVARAHRGHRLGLVLKTSMIDWLSTVEPQLRHIDTENAVTNHHMIAVNDALGCYVIAHASGWQLTLNSTPDPPNRLVQADAAVAVGHANPWGSRSPSTARWVSG